MVIKPDIDDNTELTAVAFIRAVPAIVISVTPPSQRDAAVVVTTEVSIGITCHFILEEQTHGK